MKKFLTLCAMMVCAVSLHAKDIKDLVVTTTPKMQCENCENRIKKNLRFEKGVKKIVTDLENQLVIVTYDADKTNEKNIENAFSKLDYKIEVLPMEVISSVAIGFSDNGKGKPCCKKKAVCPVKSECNRKDCGKNDCTKNDCKHNQHCTKDKK
jgi:heavy metal-associated domain protein